MLHFDPTTYTHALCTVIPSFYVNQLGKEQYDWGYSSVRPQSLVLARSHGKQVPQVNANGRPINMARYAQPHEKHVVVVIPSNVVGRVWEEARP